MEMYLLVTTKNISDVYLYFRAWQFFKPALLNTRFISVNILPIYFRKPANILRKNPLPKSRLQEKCGRKCVICEKGFRGELKTRCGRFIKNGNFLNQRC
jgi:hypothetical protein